MMILWNQYGDIKKISVTIVQAIHTFFCHVQRCAISDFLH